MCSGSSAEPALGNPKNFWVPCSIKSSAAMIRSTDSMRGDQVANSIVSPLRVAAAGLYPHDKTPAACRPPASCGPAESNGYIRLAGSQWARENVIVGSPLHTRQCGRHSLREDLENACAIESPCRHRARLHTCIAGERATADRKEPVRRDGV